MKILKDKTMEDLKDCIIYYSGNYCSNQTWVDNAQKAFDEGKIHECKKWIKALHWEHFN